MIGLTPKQLGCFRFIEKYIAENGMAPSYKEIAAALNLNSVSGVARMTAGLKARGHITYQDGVSRSIQIVKRNKVAIKDEIYGPLERYAKETGRSVETITNALLRDAMGLVA